MTLKNPTSEEARELYLNGKSSLSIAKEYNVDKSTILKRLKLNKDWDKIKRKSHKIKKKKQYKGICIFCKKAFMGKNKQKYCSTKCIKANWQKNNPRILSKKQKEIKNKKRRVLEKKKTIKKIWIEKYEILLKKYHKRNITKIATRLATRGPQTKNSMVSRSKKYNVECDITVEDIRQLIYDNYMKPCKYDKTRLLDYKNMVFDHIIPISKGGNSKKENIQVISRFSNNLKGSLSNKQFYMLLDWLNSIDEETRKDIKIRLANGIH